MTTQTTSQLDGYFKDRYVGDTTDLIPDWAVIGGMFPFDKDNKLGNEYVRSVLLSMPHGITFADAAQDTTLNDSVPIYTSDARLASDEFWLRVSIAQGLLNRAGGDAQSFGRIMDPIVKKMEDSSYFYREMCLLHGGRHIGAVQSSGTTDPAGGTTMTIAFSSATFASGLWAQMEQAKIDFYDDPADGGTKHNTTSPVTVTSVDCSAATIAVSGAAADLTTIYNNRTDAYAKPVGSDGKWFNGLRKICGQTSGTFQSINSSSYTLWKANTHSADSVPLKFATVAKAAAKTFARGGKGRRVCLVSHASWTDMQIDSLLYRNEVNKKGGELDQGAESFTWRTVTGPIEFIMHPMMMPGEAFIFDPGVFKRIGTTDHTWSVPGEGGEPRFFVRSENKTSFQIRCMWDQALFCEDLSSCCLVTDIVPNTTGV